MHMITEETWNLLSEDKKRTLTLFIKQLQHHEFIQSGNGDFLRVKHLQIKKRSRRRWKNKTKTPFKPETKDIDVKMKEIDVETTTEAEVIDAETTPDTKGIEVKPTPDTKGIEVKPTPSNSEVLPENDVKTINEEKSNNEKIVVDFIHNTKRRLLNTLL